MSMESSIRTNAKVFELPTALGIPQRIEGWREEERLGMLKFGYKGTVTAEGCKKGVCVKYKALVLSRDGREWRTPRQWERLGMPHYGGCLTQATADALWELVERGFEVGLWYDCRIRTSSIMIGLKLVPVERYVVCTSCGVVVNGVKLSNPYCRSVEECIERILEDYRHEVERMREPPMPSPESAIAERLLKEYPELEAFGVEWLRAWAPHARDRIVEVARLLRRYPRLAELIGQRPASLNPYSVEVYVARDGSEVCASFGDGAYCVGDGGVRRLDLELKGSELHEGRMRGIYRPRGLLAFAARAKEYVRIL
jgi:hypothetical protein